MSRDVRRTERWKCADGKKILLRTEQKIARGMNPNKFGELYKRQRQVYTYIYSAIHTNGNLITNEPIKERGKKRKD